MRVRFGVLAAGLMSAMVWGCGGGSDVQGTGDTQPPVTDAGPDAGNDAGTTAPPNTDGGTTTTPPTTDGGTTTPPPDTDGGTTTPPPDTDGGTTTPPPDTDGGTTTPPPADGGTDGGVAVTFPGSAGWTVLQASDGLSTENVMGASVDEGGNLWVAGGTGGLFLMRQGNTAFEQFGLSAGLHPYGYLENGAPADLNPYLEALSVSGGKSGVAFVGYNGKAPSPGDKDCESNWDNGTKDPAIYKSGDVDKVTLNGPGLGVIHYDIFSGPGVVSHEPAGREKLCKIYRLLYEHGSDNLWIGANHGFAWANAEFTGNPTCDGELNCTGTFEHVHPAINDNAGNFLTDLYYGIALDLEVPHDVWFGGLIRSTRFKYGTFAGDFFDKAEQGSENDMSNMWDVWPDAVSNFPAPNQRKDDHVSGIVALPDGSVLISSFDFGVRHLSRDGVLLNEVTGFDQHVNAMARDPEDGSIWIGHTGFGLGVTQILADGTIQQYGAAALGGASSMTVTDIQIDTFSKTIDPAVKHNRVLISLRCDEDPSCNFSSGVVAIHENQ
jgi:hypothetical protein